MILYVDETENEEFFIVTGLLMPSKEDTDLAYKQFKNRVKDIKIAQKEKRKLFMEFKSIIMDRTYQKPKIKMLECLNEINNSIIYSAYIKKEGKFTQEKKESTYIALLKKIVEYITYDIDVIFDCFNKKDFEERIIMVIGSISNVISIIPKDSKSESGLKFVDNLCSTIRLYRSNKDEWHFYEIIEKNVKEV